VATVEEIDRALLPAVAQLARHARPQGARVRRRGDARRTHLQDATPVTLGQVISGWVAQLDDATKFLHHARDALYPLALGGTAVGTGINSPARFGELVAQHIAQATGQAVHVGAQQVRGAVRARRDGQRERGAAHAGGIVMKIANDVRLYASGPRAGFGEITIPDNEPGSSIMPGKINPTQSEALTMVAVQVFGNDAAVAFAGTQGHFQLNVYKPVILHNTLESIELLADGIRSFDERCARGIEPNRERIRRNVEESLMLVTALNPHIGYENSAKIALKAHRDGSSLREAALALGIVSADDFDKWIDPGEMTKPEDA
jgi:fumarate hydratase class II